MTSSIFIVDEYYELLAVHRAFLEAKFCDDPTDNDVSWSPILASLHERLILKLIEAAVSRNGESERIQWNEWLVISDTRREWTVALNRARTQAQWENWSDTEKLRYSRPLLAPFTFTDELLLSFIEQV